MAVSGPFPVLHSSRWRRPARQASRSIARLICQTQQPAGALKRVDDRRLRAIDLASPHPTRDADQLPPRGRPRSTGFEHGGDALGGAGEPCEILVNLLLGERRLHHDRLGSTKNFPGRSAGS